MGLSAPVVELIASSSGLLWALEATLFVTVRGLTSCWPLDASVLAEQPAIVSAAMQDAMSGKKDVNRIANLLKDDVLVIISPTHTTSKTNR